MNKSEIEQKSDSLFAKFTKGLANTNMLKAVALPVAIGAIGVLYGAGAEAGGQVELLKAGGQAALDAYQKVVDANMYGNVTDYISAAFKGEHKSFGGNISGVGLATLLGGPVATASSILLARGIEKFKSMTGSERDNKKENEQDRVATGSKALESPSINQQDQFTARRPKFG